MTTALSIERELRREWGEAAMLHPEAFDSALGIEVRKIGSDGRPQRAVFVGGSFGPQVSDNDYLPVPCCVWKLMKRAAVGLSPLMGGEILHEADCRYQEFSVAALVASGRVLTYPAGAGA